MAVKKTDLPECQISHLDQIPERDYSLREKWAQKVRDDYQKQRDDESDAWWSRYNQYLQTPEWKRRRQAVLDRDNYLCQACRFRRAEQVHHRSYEMVGNEPLFDLVSICNQCHEMIHDHRKAVKAART